MVVIACVETMIEFELVKAEQDRPKKRSVGRPSQHWMEDGATSPMSSFKGTKFDPPDPEPKAAPSTYEDLVAAKSPLVQGLTEKEFYSNHNYSSDLGFGFRAISNEVVAYSYSNEISKDSLKNSSENLKSTLKSIKGILFFIISILLSIL